jgi:endonuclease/exonuclease/phosphatase family metal-dependent hydrolase
LNFQYYSSYPEDEAAASSRLKDVLGGPKPPDVICVQEGLASKNTLDAVGFDLKVCAGKEGKAQTVYDMVYGDANTLKICPERYHHELLCNQIYLRKDSLWELVDSGSMQISSDLDLHGGGKRAEGKLAIRSMVWVKLSRPSLPEVYVMCTHISGGRFEDQYFVQRLSEERKQQLERIVAFFESRPGAKTHDVGILVGDYNATLDYEPGGPMSGYFNSAVKGSEGVLSDAKEANLSSDQKLEELFKDYMLSPFTTIKQHNWCHAYGKEIGITSGFGHLIDHMVTNRKVESLSAEVLYLTNQKFGNKKKDTELPLTDHNSVKTAFRIAWDNESIVHCTNVLEKWFKSRSGNGVEKKVLKEVMSVIDPQFCEAFEKLLQYTGYEKEDSIPWEHFRDIFFSDKPIANFTRR